jgi:hypothetical protein
MKEIVQNNACVLGGSVRTVATDVSVVAGTIYAALRLDFPGDADDGKYWDTTGAGSWQAAPAAWPTATYTKGSWWTYTVPAAATTTKAGGVITLTDLTDNIAAPGSETVYSQGCESLGICTAAREVNLTQINGQATTGNNATLNLKQLNVVNATGSAIIASSTGSNGHGMSVSGNGTGHGLLATSGAGATGDGINATSQATAGNGLSLTGTSATGAGLKTSCASGYGINATGNFGILANATYANQFQGATTGLRIWGYTSGPALEVVAVSGNAATLTAAGTGHGIAATGSGSGAGILSTGGATGSGIRGIGGATSGDGLQVSATSGHGIRSTTVGGHGILASSSGSGCGLVSTTTVAGQDGIYAGGNGAGHGINLVAGATGHGAKFLGGATSGNGILAQAQNNNDAGIKGTPHGTGSGLDATLSAVPAIADAVCDEVISTGHAVANSLGKIVYDNLNAAVAGPNAANVTQWDGHAVLAHTVEGAPVVTVKVGTGAATGELSIASGVVAASVSGGATATNVSDAITAINGHTDSATTGLSTGLSTISTNLDAKVSTRATPSDVATAVAGYATATNVSDAVTSIKGVAGPTLLALQGADGDTLETLSDQIDAIPEIGVDVDASELLDFAIAGHSTAGTVGAALAAALNGVGARQITLQVRVGALAVPTVLIAVYDSANTTHLFSVTTDVNGNVVLNLADGSYKLRPFKAGYTFTTPQALTVTADATVAIAASAFVPPTSSDPSMCTVYGYAYDASGTPVNDVVIDFYANAPIGVGAGLLTTTKVSVTSGAGTWADGYFEVELIRDAEVRLASKLPKLDGLTITVPDDSSAELADLVEEAK